MKPPRKVSKREKMIFPVAAFLICTLHRTRSDRPVGHAVLWESAQGKYGHRDDWPNTARTAFIDIVTILLGFSVGASTQADTFLQPKSMLIFGLGALSFAIATAGGVLFAKFMNLFLTEKINPLVGAAGVSAVPDSARVVQMVGQQEDPHNFLLMHAMAPNVAGVDRFSGCRRCVVGRVDVPSNERRNSCHQSRLRVRLGSQVRERPCPAAVHDAGDIREPQATGHDSSRLRRS